MIIGVPKEIKTHEYRVGLIPQSVAKLVQAGHKVMIQSMAGDGIGASDKAYATAGAIVVSSADDIYADAELIVKVKEPQLKECSQLTSKHILFAFLHLAATPKIASLLQKTGVNAIAYETVEHDGKLPILMPMSMIAGRVAVQRGAYYLEKPQGGSGVLLGAVTGAKPSKVTVLGAGVVGSNAVAVALGMGAEVTVFDNTENKLHDLKNMHINCSDRLHIKVADAKDIDDSVMNADLVIGAVLVPGATAPKLVSRDSISKMRAGSVIADVAIDQGGCFETSRPTDFSAPIYLEHGIIHQCITNLPSAVALSATLALNHVTLPYILELASKGYRRACFDNPELLQGLNLCQGAITYQSVAKAMGETYTPALEALQA